MHCLPFLCAAWIIGMGLNGSALAQSPASDPAAPEATEEKAVAAKRLALPFGMPAPPYPEAARQRNLQGRTTIAVHWTAEGFVGDVFLVKTSGSDLLDRAAMRFAYENWRVDPRTVTPEAFIKTIAFTPPK